jgi:hypothetical protein
MENFVNRKLEASHDNDLKEEINDTNDFLNNKYIFTNNAKETISNKRLKEIHEASSTGLSFQKYKNLLMARGCKEYKSGGERGLTNLKEIELDKQNTN